jgi:hypothetical protein
LALRVDSLARTQQGLWAEVERRERIVAQRDGIEQRLQESEATLKTIFEHSRDTIMITRRAVS